MPDPNMKRRSRFSASAIEAMVKAAAMAGNSTGIRLDYAIRANRNFLTVARSWWSPAMIQAEAVSLTFCRTAAAEPPCLGTEREPECPDGDRE